MTKEEIKERLKHFDEEVALLNSNNPRDLSIQRILRSLLEEDWNNFDIIHIIGDAGKYCFNQVLSPLKLTMNEFTFYKKGLSINKRNKNVKWTLDGIYYDNAYVIDIDRYVDVYTGKMITDKNIIESLTNYSENPLKCYISIPGSITNIYFDKVYIKETSIKRQSFYPHPPMRINCNAIVCGNQYILVSPVHESKLKRVKSYYNIKYEQDSNTELEIFGVKFNVDKDELFSKGRTF